MILKINLNDKKIKPTQLGKSIEKKLCFLIRREKTFLKEVATTEGGLALMKYHDDVKIVLRRKEKFIFYASVSVDDYS